MRLWHKNLISKLPSKQLLGQHREVTALRGRGWGRRHSVVDYVFRHPYGMLYEYHVRVMDEMERRGYRVSPEWRDQEYRGKAIGYDSSAFTATCRGDYPEHDSAYLSECVENLRRKNVCVCV